MMIIHRRRRIVAEARRKAFVEAQDAAFTKMVELDLGFDARQAVAKAICDRFKEG